MDMGWLLGGSLSAIRGAFTPVQVRDALLACISRAVEHASSQQDMNADLIWMVLTTEAPDAQTESLLSTDFAAPSMPLAWRRAMHDVLTSSETFVLDGADLDEFCASAFDWYVDALFLEASKPESSLANAVMLSALRALISGQQPNELPVPASAASNLHMVPVPARLFTCRAVAETEHLLQQHAVVHLSGSAGSGKSSVARIVADRARAENSELSVWWLDGATRDGLEAGCAELCAELSVTPGEDVLTQTKALLARGQEWLVVVDNLAAELSLNEIVPSGTPGVRTVVTARSPLGAPTESVVSLAVADVELMASIVHSLLDGTALSARGERVIETSGGNPLVLATVCHYLTATGASEEDVLDLLESRPDVVLDETLGGSYPVSFTKVVRKCLTQIQGSIASDLVSVIALAGGRLRRRDLERIVNPADRADMFEGLRAARTLGLIDANEEAFSCHAQMAAVVVKMVDHRILHRLAESTFSLLQDEAPHADGIGIREYVRIADHVRTNCSLRADAEFGARLALANQLCLYGLGRTADHQLALAQEAMPQPAGPLHQAQLGVTRAVVLFHRGRVAEAERLARNVLEQGLLTASEVPQDSARELFIRTTLCIAQCKAYIEDWGGAAQAAHFAVEASGRAPEVRAVELKLLIPGAEPQARLDAYCELAGPTPGSWTRGCLRCER